MEWERRGIMLYTADDRPGRALYIAMAASVENAEAIVKAHNKGAYEYDKERLSGVRERDQRIAKIQRGLR